MPSVARLREVFAYDAETGALTWKYSRGSRAPAGAAAGCVRADGYRVVRFEGRLLYAHRIAWALVHDCEPDGVVDHIDGNPSNNAFRNLRVVDHAGNQQNRKGPNKNNSTGFRGVTQQRGRFVAQLSVGRSHKRFGVFGTAEEAAAAAIRGRAVNMPFSLER